MDSSSPFDSIIFGKFVSSINYFLSLNLNILIYILNSNMKYWSFYFCVRSILFRCHFCYVIVVVSHREEIRIKKSLFDSQNLWWKEISLTIWKYFVGWPADRWQIQSICPIPCGILWIIFPPFYFIWFHTKNKYFYFRKLTVLLLFSSY